MALKRVVPGSLTDAYKKREGDFSPNLVGNQFTDANSFFTLGNFSITTNLEGTAFKDFTLGQWSDYYSLDNLNITSEQLDETVSNNIFVKLNFNKEDISRYVYFGSFFKFIESELQDVILKWPASLFICSTPPQPTLDRPSNLITILDYSYDLDTNVTSFKSPLVSIENPFNLSFNQDQFGGNGINIVNDLNNYILSKFNSEEEYPILEMTGFTQTDNYIYLKVLGNCFKSLSASTFGKIDYHIKPVKSIRDNFFNNLTDFQTILLDRLQTPKYKAVFKIPIKYDDGDIGFSTQTYVWPTTDGYNLDIETFAYEEYLSSLLNLATLYDDAKTDLILRRFVSDSIKEYDTEGDGTDRFGMKVSKLLRVYGAEFDVVKKYIDGLSFANVVTYNKKDNTSDNLIKMMAKTMGFDVLLTLGGFNVNEDTAQGENSPFNGYSRELSPYEIDIELWRRLVINAWWLFRSKGTRKVLEFFLNLFNIDECLASLNERVYVAKEKLDLESIIEALDVDEVSDGESSNGFIGYNILNPINGELEFYSAGDLFFDNYGFPQVPRNNFTTWFQSDGFWYNSGNDKTEGNNPHYGDYDFGQRYWGSFRCLIPNFQSETIVERIEEKTVNYFTDYNNGSFTPGEFGQAFSDYGQQVPEYLINPTDNIRVLSAGLVQYGEDNGPKNVRDTGDTYSLRITFQAGESTLCNNCPPEVSFSEDGLIYVSNAKNELVPHNIESCCDFYWLPNNEVTQCPQILSIGLDGIVNGIENKECCTETVVGNPVTWIDGKNACILTSYIPISTDTDLGTGTNLVTTPTFFTNTDLFSSNNTTQSTSPYILDMPNTTIVPTQQVDCTGAILGLPTVINNNICNGNNCIDCSYGSLTVNQGNIVTINYELFGGATSSCCSYQSILYINNIPYTLNATAYQSQTNTITLNPGNYTIKLCLKNYTCGSGNASVSFQSTPTNTTIGNNGIVLPNIDLSDLLDGFPQTGPTESNGSTDVVSTTGGEIPVGNNEGYYCWWCPPVDSMVLACNTEQYLSTLNLTDETTITLAQTYGYNGNDLTQAQNFLNNLYGTYFQTGKCLYMFNGEPLKNEKCCKIRGGVWNNEIKICEVLPVVDECSAELVSTLYSIVGKPEDITQPVSSTNFIPLDENCCDKLNYYYGSKNISLLNVNGEIVFISVNELANNFLTPTSSPRVSCFTCPREYKEITTNINGSDIIHITTLDSNLISENCCQELGFNYQNVLSNGQTIGICTQCDNSNLIINGNAVFKSNGELLDETCCKAGGFYSLNAKCYQCPLLIDGNYLLVNTSVLGTQYTTITNSNGSKLSLTCCNYYKQQIGNSNINYNNNIGCYFT